MEFVESGKIILSFQIIVLILVFQFPVRVLFLPICVLVLPFHDVRIILHGGRGGGLDLNEETDLFRVVEKP